MLLNLNLTKSQQTSTATKITSQRDMKVFSIMATSYIRMWMHSLVKSPLQKLLIATDTAIQQRFPLPFNTKFLGMETTWSHFSVSLPSFSLGVMLCVTSCSLANTCGFSTPLALFIFRVRGAQQEGNLSSTCTYCSSVRLPIPGLHPSDTIRL